MTPQDIKPGYKQSQLGLIPEDWEVYKLKDLFNFHKGQGLSKEMVEDNGKNECILYGELYTHYNQVINEVRSKTNSDIGLKSIKGDILIPASTTTSAYDLATAAVVNKNNVLLGGDINILRKKEDNICGEFFSNYLTFHKKQEISKYGQGITIIHLYAKDFSDMLVHLPTLPEQEAIANILGKVDETIGKTQNMIEKLELRNKGLQNDLLNNPEYQKVKMDDCLKYTPRPVAKPEDKFFGLGVRSHGKGIFHKDDFDPDDIDIDVMYEVKEDDLVINITFAREQAIAIANKDDEGGLVSHRFPTYTFKKDVAIPEYFRYLILQKKIKYLLDLISPGGAGRNRVLSKKEFLKLEVAIPDVEKQKEIANILDKATAQLDLYKQKLEKLQELKKGLMQQLLTGKVRVKEFRN